MRWVTRVTVHPDSENICYVTHSGYLQYAFQAHIHKTTNYGQSWIPIGGNLPDIPLNDVIVDHSNGRCLYVASDAGVLRSTNEGQSWHVLGIGLPNAPVLDLELHIPTRKLIAFTHGHSAWAIDLTTTSHAVEPESTIPANIELFQNYPNPFNPKTMIKFKTQRSEHVKLYLFDVLGREVAIVVDQELSAGTYVKELDAKELASGVYMYRLESGGKHITRKLVLTK